jgi:hypothetical protein
LAPSCRGRRNPSRSLNVRLEVLARPKRSASDDPDRRDRRYGQRLFISFAAAIALHEVFAGFVPRSSAPKPQEREVAAQTITLTKRPKPSPTPKPTPRVTAPPRPSPAPQTAVKAPAAKAASTPHAAIGGAAAPKRIALVTPRPVPPHAPPVSLATGTQLGRQNGGQGTGAGAGNGTSGLGGSGSGAGTTGNGNGGDANAACGHVDLLPGRVDYEPDGTVLQYVIAKVTTANDVLVGRFPYPFTYSAERLNPFTHEDVAMAENGGVPVQLPPGNVDPSTLLPAVAFVLKYTNPSDGHSTLMPCSGQSP